MAVTYGVDNRIPLSTLTYEKNSSTNAWDYVNTFRNVESLNYNFGSSITIYGNILAADALYDESNKGNVYIYKKTNGTWVFYEKITNHGITNESFGSSLKLISETELIIGSSGHAYTYKEIGGTCTETFKFEGADNTNFGQYSTLNPDGNTAFISDTSYNSSVGAVYVYEKTPIAGLTFDGYNQLALTNTPTYVSSKLAYISNVYDIGTLTSDIIINKSGDYTSLALDTSSNVAYFSNVTVGGRCDCSVQND